jgi:DnaK suppressor protein
MTTAESNNFKNMLEAKQADLAQFVGNREGIAIERSAEALDQVQNAAERDVAIRNLDRESNLLRNVVDALRRIDDGAFGVCLRCEGDISPKRLAAVPWTAFCIRCQEIADRNQTGVGSESIEELLANAA